MVQLSVSKERYEKWSKEDFDIIILKIKTGVIKAGRFSHLVKVKKDPNIMKGKVFFDESADSKKHSTK